MARLLVRERATCREFEIDATALPFWEARVEVLEHIPELGDEPADAEPAEPAPAPPGITKPSVKAASRSAENKEE